MIPEHLLQGLVQQVRRRVVAGRLVPAHGVDHGLVHVLDGLDEVALAEDQVHALVDQILAPAVAIDEAFSAYERAVGEAREALAGITLPSSAQDIE